MKQVTQHRWSGWPGAICLDCGMEDQIEHCLAVHDTGLWCVEGHFMCDEHPLNQCPEHVNPPCLGQKR